jgi:hypothetical protein
MKTTISELRILVDAIIEEARKSKKKPKDHPDRMKANHPNAYQYDEALDFSNPLGSYNLYKSQGGASWGPNTGAGPKVDDNIRFPPQKLNLGEGVDPNSEWAQLVESNNLENVWESVARWYDHQGLGLGEGSAVLDEKHVGFKKLKNQIKKKEGYSNDQSKAVAASIGFKKFGKKGMAAKAAAGRKKK